jgi:hypothetical protein
LAGPKLGHSTTTTLVGIPEFSKKKYFQKIIKEENVQKESKIQKF